MELHMTSDQNEALVRALTRYLDGHGMADFDKDEQDLEDILAALSNA